MSVVKTRSDAESGAVLRPVADDFDRFHPRTDAELAFSGVFERIEREEKSPFSKLRAQPTWLRRAIALLMLGVIVVVAGPLSPRADIGTYPAVRMALHLGALLGLGSLCIWVALKPLHVPAWSRTKTWLAIGLAITSTLVLCALPHVESNATGSTGGCLAYGSLLSIPVFAVVRVLDRGAILSAVLAGAAGGLAGNVALQLHCPVNERGHLLSGHFPVLLVFVAIGLAVWLRKRRQQQV